MSLSGPLHDKGNVTTVKVLQERDRISNTTLMLLSVVVSCSRVCYNAYVPDLTREERNGNDAGADPGQYRIVEQVGKGGMATVFKAYQPGLDRYVAVKVLPPTTLTKRASPSASCARRRPSPPGPSSHPAVYDFGQADGCRTS